MSGQDQWEDVANQPVPEVTGPFAVARPVDGYAFTLDPESPELRYQRQPKPATPPVPHREPPTRIADQVRVTGVWQPGGPAQQILPPVRLPRPNVVKALLSGLIPLGLLGGGIFFVMRLYGFV